MIELKSVMQHYGVKPVLRDVSLRIAAGELVAVMGPNVWARVPCCRPWPDC